ncbi:MAG: hypothetical protein K6U74_11330 [Firmicutes bacterium]|nr:hypothetical protein [Bacillota bacterium]
MPHAIFAAAGLVVLSFLCNLPLGRWRVSVKKFSVPWFLAVHLSVPLIIFIRIKMGLSAWFIPVTLGAAVAGQVVGGRSLSPGRTKKA